MTDYKNLVKHGLALLSDSDGAENTRIATPHNDDLSGIAAGITFNASVYGTQSEPAATVTKELVVLAFALGYKQAQADAVKLDDCWNE